MYSDIRDVLQLIFPKLDEEVTDAIIAAWGQPEAVTNLKEVAKSSKSMTDKVGFNQMQM
eukprot:gene948-1858_t